MLGLGLTHHEIVLLSCASLGNSKIFKLSFGRVSENDVIPDYLQPFIAKQDASLYTPIDHASWRYILRVSKRFFKGHAHRKYLDGLKETGISSERIPLISEMDECLRRFGWRAVAVVGFVPPAVFLEFQSKGILVIACDMRRLENLGYTPAPDIVHEAAGHAPIIADEEYRTYLRSYGQVARNAIFSKKDLDMYNAIRELSDLKEDPKTTPSEIQTAQKHLDELGETMSDTSEASQLSRMAWWTLEYGLVGDLKNPTIYGAGLLSSVSESYHCLENAVKKVPLAVSCVAQGYDITKPQPQLYVTPDFATLTKVLEEFADTMAFRRGGIEGLEKAKRAETTTTTVLDSRIQISATLTDYKKDRDGNPIYLQYKGPTQLAVGDRELVNQGPAHHKLGFSTPIGKVVLADGKKKSSASLSPKDLAELGFSGGKKSSLSFESGVKVEGILKSELLSGGNAQILTFDQCTITLGAEILFQPDWGTFDMACGESVMSVAGGAADRSAYLKATGGFKQRPASQKTNSMPETVALEAQYADLRAIREKNEVAKKTSELAEIHRWLDENSPEDWLLRLELLELDFTHKLGAPWAKTARARLDLLAKKSRETGELISRGLELLQ